MALLRGYLFAIADQERQFVKIGMTRDVYARFHQTSADFPLKLELVHYFACTYAKFREAKVRIALRDLHIRGEWYRWDARIKIALDQVMDISDNEIKSVLDETSTKRSHNYPVKREDTGEVFSTARIAALTVLGEAKLAPKIRLAVRTGCKCGPTTWSKA
jgi:hypothetical protein